MLLRVCVIVPRVGRTEILGIASEMRTATIAITTMSSTSVNPRLWGRGSNLEGGEAALVGAT